MTPSQLFTTKTTEGRAHLNKAGPLTLLQDRGRQGSQILGICTSGAADAYAFAWSNTLLGNQENAAALEISLGPFEVSFDSSTRIALCGADCGATLNGKKIIPWSSHKVKPGDTLRLSMARSGLRIYLAIAGGFLCNHIFSSCAQLSNDGKNLSLQNADQLHYQPVENVTPCRNVHWQAIPDYTTTLELNLYPCYQFLHFEKNEILKLLSDDYRIGVDSNRMGYRLEGQNVNWHRKGIVSEGIAFGSVQIPPNGQPIVLLNDRQTIGGYPKVGCIAAADCYQLAQRRPGQKVTFKLASLPSVTLTEGNRL